LHKVLSAFQRLLERVKSTSENEKKNLKKIRVVLTTFANVDTKVEEVEASLVPLNIKADMTSIGLKLRPTDKTFGLLPQGARRRAQKNGCQAERVD
jgi:hypothetical protein